MVRAAIAQFSQGALPDVMHARVLDRALALRRQTRRTGAPVLQAREHRRQRVARHSGQLGLRRGVQRVGRRRRIHAPALTLVAHAARVGVEGAHVRAGRLRVAPASAVLMGLGADAPLVRHDAGLRVFKAAPGHCELLRVGDEGRPIDVARDGWRAIFDDQPAVGGGCHRTVRVDGIVLKEVEANVRVVAAVVGAHGHEMRAVPEKPLGSRGAWVLEGWGASGDAHDARPALVRAAANPLRDRERRRSARARRGAPIRRAILPALRLLKDGRRPRGGLLARSALALGRFVRLPRRPPESCRLAEPPLLACRGLLGLVFGRLALGVRLLLDHRGLSRGLRVHHLLAPRGFELFDRLGVVLRLLLCEGFHALARGLLVRRLLALGGRLSLEDRAVGSVVLADRL
mmetsp:Transcript_11158/g.46464  ORF Transcript_11158/g.46464 Transcript_11158/m.46464 type:complete len:402 (-) Transcript_11158:393-1598(-)